VNLVSNGLFEAAIKVALVFSLVLFAFVIATQIHHAR